MKTYKNLYPQIHTWENLEAAYRWARRGKRGRLPAADFEFAWESQLLRWPEHFSKTAALPKTHRKDKLVYLHSGC